MSDPALSSMKSQHPQLKVPYIEITERELKTAEGVHATIDIGNTALKLYNGARAYRDYNWLLNQPRFNAAGNFRGMVVSAKAKAAYIVNIKNAQVLEEFAKHAAFAGAAIEFAKNVSQSQFTNDPLLNFQMLTSDAESAISRVLAGTVTGPIHLTTAGLMQVCGGLGVSTRYVAVANNAVVRLETTIDNVTAPSAITGYNNAIARVIITTVIPSD